MSDQSGPSHFEVLFEAAFRDYENQTGKILANHPLAEKLQSCDSVESVTAVLREQTESSSEIQGDDRVLKPVKNVLSVLHRLSSTSAVNFGQHLGLVRPQVPIEYQCLDYHSLAYSTCDGNTHRARYPTLCLCLSFVYERAYS